MATSTHARCECSIYLEELMGAGAADMRLNGNCLNCGYPVSAHPRRPEGATSAGGSAGRSTNTRPVDYAVRAAFHPYISEIPILYKRWRFEDCPTIAELTKCANAFYDSLPVRPSSFKMYQDGVELLEDGDFDPGLPTIAIIPSYYNMTLEVQNWEVAENRKRLKEICFEQRISAEVKRTSGNSVRLKLKHTVLGDIIRCQDAIVATVGSQGTVIAGELQEEFGSLAPGVLICGAHGLVRTDGIDSFEDYSFSERMSRWSGP